VTGGFTHVTLSLGHLGELIRAFFADHATLSQQLNLEFVAEEQPTGTAGSLLLVPDLPETFLVMNGDILTTLDYRRLIEFHRASGAWLTIATHRQTVRLDLGVLELQADAVVNYREKPQFEYPVSMGVYVYDRRVLSFIPPHQYFDFPDLVLQLLAHGKKVAAYASDAVWLDIGRREDYQMAQEVFARDPAQFRMAGWSSTPPAGTR